MAYTTGTTGDRNIVNVNGNRYFADKKPVTPISKPKTTTNTYTVSSGSSKSSGSSGGT